MYVYFIIKAGKTEHNSCFYSQTNVITYFWLLQSHFIMFNFELLVEKMIASTVL